MAKKAKIVKNKKKFPWGKIWYYIKSLFNNQIAMDCRMRKKWYVTLIIFILSMAISVIPQVVTASQTKGSQYLSSGNDPIALALYDYAKSETSPDITFENKEDKIDSSLLPEKPNTPIYTYSRLDEYTTKKQKLLDVYYVNLAKNDPLYNSTLEMIRKDNELTTESFRTASYIIFTPSYFESQLYNVNTGTKLNGVSGDYKNLGKQFEGKTFKTILSFLNEGETKLTPSKVITNYSPFVDKLYINNRNRLIWVQFGIAIGLNAGITLLMGLLIFLLTRGKNNPLKSTIKWYHGFGISTWLSMTPALLSLVLGFFLSNFAMMIYILTFGIRCMWLSMKNLRPQYEQK